MRVIVAGSFDIIHPGHIYLFQEAAKLGELYVIVARDSSILRIKKQPPIIPEQQRLEVVQAIKYVSFATLGNEGPDFLSKPLSYNPDIILLGPNQKISIEDLKLELNKRNYSHVQVKRLETLYDKTSLCSSSAIKQKIISQKNGSNGNNNT